MKSAFGYIRSGPTRPSAAKQSDELKQFSKAKLTIFSDSNSNKSRSGYLQLIDDLVSNPKSELFIYDLVSLDICFSNLTQYLDFFALIEKYEIKIICLKDSIPLLTPLNFKSLYEKTSKQLHKEHIQTSFLKRKAAGLTVGRPSQRNDFKIQKLRQEGLTYREIAQRLKVSIGVVQRGVKACET